MFLYLPLHMLGWACIFHQSYHDICGEHTFQVNYTAGMVQRVSDQISLNNIQNLFKYIFPTLERVEMFQYLDLQHIGLTVYSHRWALENIKMKIREGVTNSPKKYEINS